MTKLGMPGIARALTKWRERPTCANPACTATSLMRAVSNRQTGIRLFEQWFCGPDCFEAGARQEILQLLSARSGQDRTPAMRIPLGLLLLSRGILTHEQLKVALDQQRQTGGNFGEVVQELGFATAQHVTAAVASQWSCSVFPLGDRPLPADVRIPACLLQLYEMLPVHFSGLSKSLMMGFVSRVQHHVLYTIERITSYSVKPCFITAGEYRKHVESLAGATAENELVFDRNNTPVEIAKLVRNYVNQTGADEARFGMCRDHLWIRILGRQEMDLLFRMQND